MVKSLKNKGLKKNTNTFNKSKKKNNRKIQSKKYRNNKSIKKSKKLYKNQLYISKFNKGGFLDKFFGPKKSWNFCDLASEKYSFTESKDCTGNLEFPENKKPTFCLLDENRMNWEESYIYLAMPRNDGTSTIRICMSALNIIRKKH